MHLEGANHTFLSTPDIYEKRYMTEAMFFVIGRMVVSIASHAWQGDPSGCTP